MYKDHFGLYTAPFALSPRLQFVYRSTTFEETMAHLIYGIEGGEEIMLITGEIGTGKTLALQNLTEHIASSYEVALINVTQVNFKELLKLLLSELGVSALEGSDRADLLTALKAQLIALGRDGRRCLLIIDEAQNLDLATLEGVRLLANMGPGNQQVIQIILSGQPMLRTNVDDPGLLQLRQRIRVHYHLVTLTEKETHLYIEHRLKIAGAGRRIFKPDAVRRLHELAMGIPRLVNIVADRALLSAFVAGDQEVSAKHIEDDPSLVRSPSEENKQAETASQAAEPASPAPIPMNPQVESQETVETVEAVEPEQFEDDSGSSARWWLIAAVVVALAAAAYLANQQGWFAGTDDVPEQERVIEPTPAVVDSIVADEKTEVVDTVAVALDTAMVEAAAVSVDTIVVDPQVVPDEPPLAQPVSKFLVDELAGYCIHIGSFQDLSRADRFAVVQTAMDHPVSIKSVMLDDIQWYRVYLGPWATRNQAHSVQQELMESNPTGWTMVIRLK